MSSVYETLSKVNVGHLIEKKGKFGYLPWSDAVDLLLQYYPTSVWTNTEFHNTETGMHQPYCETKSGCFVEVTVTIEGINRTQTHPVLDHRNITVENPSAFQVNTSIQRCLAKAIALHGLGLYIFRGEDLPDGMNTKEQTQGYNQLLELLLKEDGQGIKDMKADFDIEDFTKLWNMFDSRERSAMKELTKDL